jgi:hypothetical protein
LDALLDGCIEVLEALLELALEGADHHHFLVIVLEFKAFEGLSIPCQHLPRCGPWQSLQDRTHLLGLTAEEDLSELIGLVEEAHPRHRTAEEVEVPLTVLNH